MGPPISKVLWSPEFVSQTLEILPVALVGGQIGWLKPVHADALRIGLSRSHDPAGAVLEALRWYPLDPVVVHSTSWRPDDGRIILTYLAVVRPPATLVADSLVAIPVGRAELARVDVNSRVASIQVGQVLEHALRHLAWLVKEDPVVGDALIDWSTVLEGYIPEPFRGLSS
jgi:hypothetical protein